MLIICDGPIRDPSTNPHGKSLVYQFTLFTTNPSEEESRDMQIQFTIHNRSFLARIEERRGDKPEIYQVKIEQKNIRYKLKSFADNWGREENSPSAQQHSKISCPNHSHTFICCGSFLMCVVIPPTGEEREKKNHLSPHVLKREVEDLDGKTTKTTKGAKEKEEMFSFCKEVRAGNDTFGEKANIRGMAGCQLMYPFLFVFIRGVMNLDGEME
ncbi:hypothetical protein TNCV_635201 [Trichonephila clavipes]|nr:hypothetical protein TNCV_635201 [Trichonephila clavipes]